MGNHLTIEPHLLGSIEYFTVITAYDHVYQEINDHYMKQTYRNRYQILTSQGVFNLTVPVHFHRLTCVKDVRIDYSQAWLKDHLRAWEAAYAKAPFFYDFSPLFFTIFNKKHDFLIDLKQELLTSCLKLLGSDLTTSPTKSYQKKLENQANDFRNVIQAKKSFQNRNNYRPYTYTQNFGNTFVPNLSVIDVLFNCGMDAMRVIKASRMQPQEQ